MKTQPNQVPAARHRLPAVCIHLVLTATLVLGLLVAATAVGMGIARAEDLNAIVRPDTGLNNGAWRFYSRPKYITSRWDEATSGVDLGFRPN